MACIVLPHKSCVCLSELCVYLLWLIQPCGFVSLFRTWVTSVVTLVRVGGENTIESQHGLYYLYLIKILPFILSFLFGDAKYSYLVLQIL